MLGKFITTGHDNLCCIAHMKKSMETYTCRCVSGLSRGCTTRSWPPAAFESRRACSLGHSARMLLQSVHLQAALRLLYKLN